MKERLIGVLVNVCRLCVAVAFLLSGITKIIDPSGTAYKIHDYAAAFHCGALAPHIISIVMSVALACIEFRIGFCVLFGIFRRVTARMAMAFMCVFTPLTLYLAIADPVSDCGCFGDAIILTNWQTFFKNVFLLACSAVLVFFHERQPRLISEARQWIVLMYSQAFVILLAMFCLWKLPVIDFRPYRIGNNLAELMQDPEDLEYETTFLMEKDGTQQWFTLEEYPDSTWTFVDSKTEVVGDVELPVIDNLQMYTQDTGEDITQEVLGDQNYVFLLIAPDLSTADDGSMDAYNNIYEYSLAQGYRFLCLTSSNDSIISRWRDMTGAEYSFCHTDELTLKTMVRSNPGLMLLKGGVVYNKWSHNEMPELDEDSKPLEQIALGSLNPDGELKVVLRLFLWFVLPLLIVTSLDRIWLFVAYILRRRNILEKKTQKTIIVKLLNRSRKMRKKIVAGNWKMNLNLQEGVALATELKEALAAEKPNCDVIICTPFIHLATVAGITEGTVIGLGAENCADKEKGAYTGEVSASQVKSTGAQYVILGHSERRAYYGETAEILKEKVNLALANGLKVIFCIGEVLEEREANKQNEVVGGQLADSLFDLTEEQLSNVILAYEPVWAIGTGKTATAEQAQDMHAFIRGVIAGRFGEKAAEEISILYGGSCKPSNAKEIFSKPDVDGGLIGGAALKCADFKGIIDAWN